MGQHADDLALQEQNENTRWHKELNPRGYKTSEDFVWTTNSGAKLKLSQMTTSHIENCINMLDKLIIDTYQIHGDEPKYGAGGGMDRAMHEQNSEIENTIDIFKKELGKRNA